MQRLRRLLRRPGLREAEGVFVAEGVKVIASALESGARIESLYVAAEGQGRPEIEALATRALEAGARVFDLGPGIMERVADTVTPQSLSAVVAVPQVTLDDVARAGERGDRLLLVCIDVRDPGNLGAIVRSGAAAGATGVVCCAGTADPYNPKAVRATAGAVFTVPIARSGEPHETLTELAGHGFRLVATTAHEGEDFAAVDLSGDIALLLGNEAAGLSSQVVAVADMKVTVPMAAVTESLNVAMTATVLAHEIARRRRLGRDAGTP